MSNTAHLLTLLPIICLYHVMRCYADDTKVIKLLNRIESNNNVVNNVTRIHNDADQMKVLTASKQIIEDAGKLQVLMNRDDIIKSYYTKQLKKRISDTRLDLASIQSDTYHILQLAKSNWAKQTYKNQVKVIKRLVKQIDKAVSEAKKKQSGLDKGTISKVKSKYRDIMECIDMLEAALRRYHFTGFARQLSPIILSVNTEQHVNKANAIIHQVIALAEKDASQAYHLDGIESDFLQDPDGNVAGAFSFRGISKHAKSRPAAQIQLENDLYKIDQILFYLIFLTSPKQLELKRKYMLNATKTLRELGEVGQMAPLEVFADRLSRLAQGMKGQKDAERWSALFATAARYYTSFYEWDTVDDAVVRVLQCRDGLARQLTYARYYFGPDVHSSLTRYLVRVVDNLMDAVQRLVAHTHLRAYTPLNNALQDARDHLRDSTQHARLPHQMRNIVHALNTFLTQNGQL